jgi:hypothetical protein
MPAFTARVERPPFYRGGSASKKDDWLLPIPLPRARAPGAKKAPHALAPFPTPFRLAASEPSRMDSSVWFIGGSSFS